MNDYKELLKLQAHLDGELSEPEAREFAARLETDAEAVSLLAELRNTRAALVTFEQDVKLPESREFYWSKIERAIQSRERSSELRASPPPAWLSSLRRLLVPMAGLALLAIVGLLTTQSPRLGPSSVETAFSDPGALTYHDYTSGTTLVWLSYPAENELAFNEDERPASNQ